MIAKGPRENRVPPIRRVRDGRKGETTVWGGGEKNLSQVTFSKGDETPDIKKKACAASGNRKFLCMKKSIPREERESTAQLVSLSRVYTGKSCKPGAGQRTGEVTEGSRSG